MLPIAAVRVWSRDPQAAQRLAATLAADGIGAEWAPDLAEAVAWADVVSCATLATEPLVRGQWLGPGSHLDLIGSFTPAMREADEACLHGAQVWIDTPEALAKSGDLLHLRPGDVRGTLAELCGRPAPPRDPSARTVFKSVGTALEDLAAAVRVFESGAASA